MAKKSIRFKLRMLMANKGVKTLTEVSEKTGISRTALTRIDNNTAKRIDLDTLEKLCSYFNCDVGDILSVYAEQLTVPGLEDFEGNNN